MKSDDRGRNAFLPIALAGLLIRSKVSDGVVSVWGEVGVIDLSATGVINFGVTHSPALLKDFFSTVELTFVAGFSADFPESLRDFFSSDVIE